MPCPMGIKKDKLPNQDGRGKMADAGLGRQRLWRVSALHGSSWSFWMYHFPRAGRSEVR